MKNFHSLQFQEKLLRVVLFSALILTAIPIFVLSASWRLQHDGPIMMYCAWLMDKFNAVPYVDFFDMNAPGSYIAYWLIAKILGYGDFWLRVADFLLLGGILVATWDMQRIINRWVASASVLLFVVLYIGGGPTLVLQREGMVLLGLVLTTWIAVRPTRWHIRLRGFLIGLLFGAIFVIRPAFAMMFPFPVLFVIFDQEGIQNFRALKNIRSFLNRRTFEFILFIGLASGLILLAMAFYLWQSGAWTPFWETVNGYWPSYLVLDTRLYRREGMDRLIFIVYKMLEANSDMALPLGSLTILLGALFVTRQNTRQYKYLLLIGGLFIAAFFYPITAGKFWAYHWMPSTYMGAVVSGLIFIKAEKWTHKAYYRLSIFAAIIVVFIGAIGNIPVQTGVFARPEDAAPEGGNADRLSAYLREHLKPGEKVQGLGIVGGVNHALLMNQIQPATPYISDFYFYHHLETPFVQNMRRDFIERLKKAAPQFIIKEMCCYAPGIFDQRILPELDLYLAQKYRIAQNMENQYIIYERIETEPANKGK